MLLAKMHLFNLRICMVGDSVAFWLFNPIIEYFTLDLFINT